jgi:translocation and assembly module TamB
VQAELAGEGISVDGRPLGDGRATARYAARRGTAELLLTPTSGGTLRATLGLDGDLGLGAEGPALAQMPAEATAVADALGLGFLPAVAPGVIRSASGQVDLDLRARGPLSRLAPRGTVRVSGGRVAIAEYGEWHDIALDGRVTDDVAEVSRLEVRRGRGRLSASGAARGLRSQAATVSARMTADGFTVERAGMDFATFDLEAKATGTWRPSALALEVSVPRGVMRLPKRAPRELHSLERRKDIVVGRRAERRKQEKLAEAAVSTEKPFTITAHLVVPRNFFVKSENPRADVELKADVRYERVGSQDYAEGAIEVVRGTVEPFAGRNFTLERGRVQFTGGPLRAALLDVEAKYVNPAAVVTVNVGGPATAPEIRLSSQPPMDDAQIAMLIATGRTELKAGSGAVGTLTGEEAGRAALGAVATQAFRNLVADKLPLDTVALDSGELRAGKYVTDRIYVGYTRRFDADPLKGENENEVRVEYQISSRWMFESRYGNAQTGGASLIWSRDY